MYQQVYTPKIDTPATPAMCLQYIDDAGNSPERSYSAKEAFLKEQRAGRISTGELPDNVWVVVWFEFTKGSYRYPNGTVIYYKDAWHIAFARRNGNTLEIHDSEVHSGARQPYTTLVAVEAWFAAYGTRYVGWSTHCDGREYARKGGSMQDQDIANIIHEIWQIPANANNIRDFRGWDPLRFVYYILGDQTPYMDRKVKEKNLAKENEALKARIKELEKMTEGEASKKLVALNKALKDVIGD